MAQSTSRARRPRAQLREAAELRELRDLRSPGVGSEELNEKLPGFVYFLGYFGHVLFMFLFIFWGEFGIF